MPFYEYQCGACGHRLEALQKISDEPLIYCPECNDPSLKKLISAAAFRLKGTGWYETDFKGGKKQDKGGKKEDKKSSDKPASDSSGDTKTKAKSESSAKSDTPSKADSASSAST